MIAERIAWVAADPAALRVLELAHKVADTPTTLLVTGESGTGKDHLARLVHEFGSRRDAPYLKIDCASLPQELVESELFGHERGAFTGAVERKLGRLELAGGGTIVLDEVAGLAPVHGRPDALLGDEAQRMLLAYAWPGNVRELKNVIERALIFAKGSAIGPEDFPESVRVVSSGAVVRLRSLEEIEHEAIQATLEATRYKISKAAEILGISRKTLLDKRKKYGLD